MRNAKCEIMNAPTDVLPHNYALRIMNYEFISRLKCEKTFVLINFGLCNDDEVWL